MHISGHDTAQSPVSAQGICRIIEHGDDSAAK
jgi:hypothetical protein